MISSRAFDPATSGPFASSPTARMSVSRSIRDCRAPKFRVVHLRMSAKSSSATAPRRTRHFGSTMRSSFACARNDLFGETVEIGLEIVDAVELLELASIQCVEAGTRRLPQNLQLCNILGGALLHQAQALTKDLARIPVTAGADQSLNDFS
jgi:hypothetical protein